MKDSQLQLIDVDHLRVGMFVHLDLGWTEHPFPFSSFKLKNDEQIDTIRSLGIERVRYSPEKSDVTEPVVQFVAAPTAADDQPGAAALPAAESAPVAVSPEFAERQHRAERLREQAASLERCERQFSEATRGYRLVLQNVRSAPEQAAAAAEQVIDAMLGGISGSDDVAIRLLSEKAGEETALHSLNCTVLSVLLAKASGMRDGLRELGIGALLHDIGKLDLPDQLRWRDQHFSAAERKLFQQHVPYGVAIGTRMGLPKAALEVIGQHHEYADGSGYPYGLSAEQIAPGVRIFGVVNQYDNLCNPGNPAAALTPHDALAVMFAKMRDQFDSATMALFIRMMGVFPPGSAIQLTDGRYALSVSVNSERPLKPRVVVHDPVIPADQALVIDLEEFPEIGVQRSLKPTQLPRAVFDYLSPRRRMCYFFERSRNGVEHGVAA